MTKITYRMKVDSTQEPRAKTGTIVYPLAKSDWGMARADERISGEPTRSVTLDPTGDYPSFTVELKDVEVLRDAPITYRMREDSKVRPDIKAGTPVYSAPEDPYGIAKTASDAYGVPHIAVVRDTEQYRGPFVVPAHHLEIIRDDDSPEYDAILRNWSVHGARYAGHIYADRKKRFEDGQHVTTSSVDRVEGDLLYTRNTIYKLVPAPKAEGTPDPAPEASAADYLNPTFEFTPREREILAKAMEGYATAQSFLNAFDGDKYPSGDLEVMKDLLERLSDA